MKPAGLERNRLVALGATRGYSSREKGPQNIRAV